MLSRNDHLPTHEIRQQVIKLAQAGMPQKTISAIIGISSNTLSKYYSRELECALPVAITEIAGVAYDMARLGNEKMIAFVLKTQGARFGWQETQKHEHTVNTAELDQLRKQVEQLEQSHDKEF